MTTRSLFAALPLVAVSLGVTLAGASGSSSPSASTGLAADAGGPAAQIDRLLGALKREEQQAVQRFEHLGVSAELAERRALARGRAYVRLARAGLLPIGSGFATFIEHAAKLERLRRGLEKDLAERKSSLAERVSLGRKIEELRARRAPLEAEQEAIARAQNALLSAEEREQAFRRAFSGEPSDDHTAIYGAMPTDDTGVSDPRFVAQRGRLSFPLPGRTEIVHDKRAASSGAGLSMRARPGTEVRAVHAGRVAFADAVADYGKAVIIDHGDGYFSLSGNLGTIDVTAGDELARGARLGTLGGPPASLYFELRSGTQTIDAGEWLGL